MAKRNRWVKVSSTGQVALERCVTDGSGLYFSGPFEGFSMGFGGPGGFTRGPSRWTVDEYRERDGEQQRIEPRREFKTRKAAAAWINKRVG